MKAILMSIRPEWVAKILNGEKTIEIRKKFPKDYVGWVYIYCTKNGALLFKEESTKTYWAEEENKNYRPHYALNGKVVARFWCDKVKEIEFINPNKTCGFSCEISDDDCYYNINENECCLSQDDLYDYLQGKNGYAIHITKLEIFDKPKELSEFKRYINDSDCKKCAYGSRCPLYPCDKIQLTRAPQSYMFIEV